MYYMNYFETNRLRAERLSFKHDKELLKMHAEEKVMDTLGILKTREQSEGWLQNNLNHWDRYGYGIWIFYDKKNGRFVGRGGLRNDDVEGIKEIEVEYAIMPEYWGKGLGTEIAESILLRAQEEDLPNVVAYTQKGHEASINIMKKMGFTYEREIEYENKPHVLYRKELEKNID